MIQQGVGGGAAVVESRMLGGDTIRFAASRRRGVGAWGFTLVELMIVVVIMGVIASLAMPAMTRYVKRAKTSEAIATISAMYSLQVSYYENTQERSAATSFATCPPRPIAAPGAGKYPADVSVWVGSSQWVALGFVLDRAHYYQYSTDGSNAAMTARAVGNIDGDSVESTFERLATVNAGEIEGARIHIVNELE